MQPNFCPVCGRVKIVPVLRAILRRNGRGELEPVVLAYRCERGHLFAFDEDNACDYGKAARRIASGNGKPAPNVKIEL